MGEQNRDRTCFAIEEIQKKMSLYTSIPMALWRSFSWTLAGLLLVLSVPVAFTRLLIEVLERILDYSFGWILYIN